MIVEDIMTENPLTVTETTSIAEAANLLTERGIRHLPVVRSERSEDVVGILSDRDLGALGIRLVNDLEGADELRGRMQEAVSVLMTRGVVTVDQDSNITEAIDLMVEEKLSAIPVVEGGTRRLVGIVSYVDVLKAARDLLEDA